MHDLQPKAEGPGYVGLPVGTEKHKRPNEAAEENPVWVSSYSAWNAGSHSNNHWNHKNTNIQREFFPFLCLSKSTVRIKWSRNWTFRQRDLWRRHRSRGRTVPRAESCCLSSWPVSHQSHPETDKWRDPEQTGGRPKVEPGDTEQEKETLWFNMAALRINSRKMWWKRVYFTTHK